MDGDGTCAWRFAGDREPGTPPGLTRPCVPQAAIAASSREPPRKPSSKIWLRRERPSSKSGGADGKPKRRMETSRANRQTGPVFENQAAATSVPHGLDFRVQIGMTNRDKTQAKSASCSLVRNQTGEFDPGSERTLAAGLTHASRGTLRGTGERVSNT